MVGARGMTYLTAIFHKQSYIKDWAGCSYLLLTFIFPKQLDFVYDQEIAHSHTADQPTVSRVRATEH